MAVPEVDDTRASKRLYRCSFCGTAQTEVKTLVAGQGVFICDECVQLCQAVIGEQAAAPAAREVLDSLLPDNAPTEKLLKTLAGDNGPSERSHARRQAIVATPPDRGVRSATGAH